MYTNKKPDHGIILRSKMKECVHRPHIPYSSYRKQEYNMKTVKA
jgi:hypothetical protein